MLEQALNIQLSCFQLCLSFHDHSEASQSHIQVIDEGLFMSFHSNKEKNINEWNKEYKSNKENLQNKQTNKTLFFRKVKKWQTFTSSDQEKKKKFQITKIRDGH